MNSDPSIQNSGIRQAGALKVAVCHSCKEIWEKMESLLGNTLFIGVIKFYQSATDLLSDLDYEESFDLIFMEITHTGGDSAENGIDIAGRISRQKPQIQFIYIDGPASANIQDIFLTPVNLTGYLTDTIDPVILCRLLELVYEKKKQGEQRRLKIMSHSRPVYIRWEDIRYIESIGHKTVIYSAMGEYICREKLDDIQARLGEKFIRSHQSFLTNMDYIQRFEKHGIILDSGERIPVSRNRYSDARGAYLRYVSVRTAHAISSASP